MKKNRSLTVLTLILILIISATYCSVKPVGNNGGNLPTTSSEQPSVSSEVGQSVNPPEPPSDNMAITTVTSPVTSTSTTAPASPSTSASTNTPASPEPEEYHIGIVTWASIYQSEEEILGAEALIAQYGSVDDGGTINHITVLSPFAPDPEFTIQNIVRLAEDPFMKAIIVTFGVPETSAAFQRIRDSGRNDIILLAQETQEYPLVISKAADVVVEADNFTKGYYDIARVKEMGASTFVHMSFPRHMNIESLSRSRNVLEEACKDFGIQFVSVTVSDPTGELGVAGAKQQVYDMMPRLVDQYGKDTVYFTTNSALQEPIFKQVTELGGIFLNQDDMWADFGYPFSVDLDLTAQKGDWWAMTQEIEKDIVAKGLSGRTGSFAYSFRYCSATALYRLAVDLIEGKASGDLKKDLLAAYQAETPGCEWRAERFVDPEGTEIYNCYLLSMETYIYGEGFTSVFDIPLPPKYYSIK